MRFSATGTSRRPESTTSSPPSMRCSIGPAACSSRARMSRRSISSGASGSSSSRTTSVSGPTVRAPHLTATGRPRPTRRLPVATERSSDDLGGGEVRPGGARRLRRADRGDPRPVPGLHPRLGRRPRRARRRPAGEPRRARGHPGPVRVGQDDAPVADRRPGPADERAGRGGRRVRRRHAPGRPRRPASPARRVHLPGVRAAVDPVGRRERGGSDAPRVGGSARARPNGSPSSSSWSVSAGGPTIVRTSCRVANSSVSRSPGPSPTGRTCSSRTSPPASSTRGRDGRS